MISYILLFLTSLIFLSPKKDELKENNLYSVIFTSFIFTQLLLGAISLLLIHLKISTFPIIILSISIFIFTLFKEKESKKRLMSIRSFILFELKKYFIQNNKNKFENIISNLVTLLLILLFFSSLGPINHPDAADYHVGYPYQYFLKGGFFIDGGLHQGLLGISDYVNLSFIQERSIWLIRPIQIINLPFLILFLSNKTKNNLIALSFLSVPTFLQWSTIGKPIFLSESCLIITFIIWSNLKTKNALKLLIISSIGCIAVKISSLIIIFPISIICGYHFLKNSETSNSYQNTKYILSSKCISLSILILLFLLLDRYLITGNFLYPLLTNIFNKDDQIINEFSNTIVNYGRDKLFILNLFIPTKISSISTSLGPSILFLLIGTFWKSSNILKKGNSLLFLTFAQILLLILFCQGRPDYYAAPLLLILYQAKDIFGWICNSKIRLLFFATLIFQITQILIILLFSIYLNLNSINKYAETMINTAYGYNLSQEIDKNLIGRFLITDRNTRLYYSENYLDYDMMRRCELKNNNKNMKNPREACFQKYDINQVITSNKNYINKNLFECEKISPKRVSRNFLKKQGKYEVSYCKNKILK